MDARDQPADPETTPRYVRILVGLGVGVFLAALARALLPEPWIKTIVATVTRPVGTMWMRFIIMTVVPLVFAALATGVASLGEMTRIGRLGAKTLGFTILVSSIAVLLGVGLVQVFEPGRGLSREAIEAILETFRAGGQDHIGKAKAAKGLVDIFIDIIPQNPLEEAATAFSSPRGGMLAVMFFALVFGVALTRIDEEKARPVRGFIEGLYEVMMKIIDFGMALAPVGVGCLMFSTTATLGMDLLRPLAKYVAVVLAGLAFHQVVVYGLILRIFARVSPLAFFRQIQEVLATAFATASSNATLPTTLETSHKKLGIPREIGSFVLTLGSTANQNGTALFEGVTVLFLAQFFGVDLDLGQQIVVVLMSILAGIGTAGVPGGSLPMIVIVMQSVNIPAEGIAIVLGVDRLLDMCRTTLNVSGDLTVAACVAVAEGHALRLGHASDETPEDSEGAPKTDEANRATPHCGTRLG